MNDLMDRYSTLLDQAVEARAYRVSHPISERLREIAKDLVKKYSVIPRDVVQLHVTALTRKTRHLKPLLASAYHDEGRLLVLELMGHVAGFYRDEALKNRPSANENEIQTGDVNPGMKREQE